MITQEQIMDKSQEMMEKWGKFLDAPKAPKLENDWDRYVMARILDNTDRELKLSEDSTTSVFGTAYVQGILGMIRQIYPRLMARELVSIQPLDRPSGKVFTLKLQRDESGTKTDPSVGASYADYKDWASLGENTSIAKQMTLSLTSADVTVQTQKLKVTYTMELQQDLQAYHNLDAGAILGQAAIDEIARELDAHIINVITSNIGAGTVTYGTGVPSGYTYAEWQKKLQRAVINANALIYKRRYQGANWLIAGTDAMSELMDLNTFQFDPNFTANLANSGIVKVGMLQNVWAVYHVPYINTNTIILGRKGNSFEDAGAVFLPYVPLFIGERTWDNTAMAHTKSFASRFTTYAVDSGSCFAKVSITSDSSGLR